MMAAKGVPKLIEELGELGQVLGKKLAYWSTDDHPDGLPIASRIEEEMADVLAAISFVSHSLRLDIPKINERAAKKLALFREWDADPGNNKFSLEKSK